MSCEKAMERHSRYPSRFVLFSQERLSGFVGFSSIQECGEISSRGGAARCVFIVLGRPEFLVELCLLSITGLPCCWHDGGIESVENFVMKKDLHCHPDEVEIGSGHYVAGSCYNNIAAIQPAISTGRL